jgi:hypothetical protein
VACVFRNPIHANGGCIFADPSETIPIIPFDPTTGGGGSPLPGEGGVAEHIRRIQLDDERVLMAVIKKFLEMQRDA